LLIKPVEAGIEVYGAADRIEAKHLGGILESESRIAPAGREFGVAPLQRAMQRVIRRHSGSGTPGSEDKLPDCAFLASSTGIGGNRIDAVVEKIALQ